MDKICKISIFPNNTSLNIPKKSNLLQVLHEHGFFVEAVCGGNGICGKCTVLVDGKKQRACCYTVENDISVTLPASEKINESARYSTADDFSFEAGAFLAFDIGTTTVVCALLDSNGNEYTRIGSENPQTVYGADVISRIRASRSGYSEKLTELVRNEMAKLAESVCAQAGISTDDIRKVSVAGNPAMQQMFLGIELDNLIKIPYNSIIDHTCYLLSSEYISNIKNADMIIVPDISAYVGGDALACILSTELYKSENTVLMVDIGTNGEMVIGNKTGMLSCATAAGPALEGAGISCGMRGVPGAIKNFSLNGGVPEYTVIGDCKPTGICGSGLVDAVAAFLDAGSIDNRGRILTDDGLLHLAENVSLTSDDIRAFQTAKGAIAAGIDILTGEFGIDKNSVHSVKLAGSFGSNINIKSAIRTGLLPFNYDVPIESVGNAACDGAAKLFCDCELIDEMDTVCRQVNTVELATHPQFMKTFAKNMYFNFEV